MYSCCFLPSSLHFSSQIKKMWSKLKSSWMKEHEDLAVDRRSEEQTNHNSSSSKMQTPSRLDVNDEYRRAVRTKSYTEIYAKVHKHHHLIRSQSTPTTPPPPPPVSALTSPSPTSTVTNYSNLSDYLDQTDEEFLLRSIRSRRIKSLLHDYFLIGVEASHLCSSILISIHLARLQRHKFHRLLTTTKYAELTSYVDLENPLADLQLSQFRRVHERYASLITRLTISHRKIKRRVKILRIFKCTSGVVLVGVCAGLSVAVLVVVTHGLLGATVAVCPLALWFGWFNSFHLSRMTQQEKQVDMAEKGAYIISRDLETLRSMVTRLHYEIDHGKDVVRMFMKSGSDQRMYLPKEVLREMYGNGEWFLEELDELEEHVFWCFKTINRTRRLLVRELGDGGGDGGSSRSGSETPETPPSSPAGGSA